MARGAMLPYLARAAREAREGAGRKPHEVAYSRLGLPGVHPTTVWHFEKEDAWPKNPDRVIALYAAELGLDPLDIWTRALELWRTEGGGLHAVGPPPPPGPTPGEEFDDVTAEIHRAADVAERQTQPGQAPGPGESGAPATPTPDQDDRRGR